MVSGLVRRLVEIEPASNATEQQVILSLERRASLEISVAVTLVLVAVIAWCGLRISVAMRRGARHAGRRARKPKGVRAKKSSVDAPR